jgi:hypothetical protein
VGEVFGQINIAQGGAGAALLVVFFLVVGGRLVPRRYLEDLRRDKNDQLREKQAELDLWRTAAQSEAAARRELQAQNAQLLELGRTGVHVLTSLPTPQGVTAGAPVDQAPASQP